MRRRLDMTPGAFRAVVFLLLLTLFLFGVNLTFTARQVHNVRALQATAARNAASVVELCQAGNRSNAQQVFLWQHLVQVSAAVPPPGETAAQQRKRLATARAFIAYVEKKFKPLNCSRRPPRPR